LLEHDFYSSSVRESGVENLGLREEKKKGKGSGAPRTSERTQSL
jgi:hypothetical protein